MNTTVVLPDYTIGPNALHKFSEICAPLGKTLLIVGGKTALEKASPKLQQVLSNSPFTVADTIHYGHDCTYQTVKAVAERAKTCNADFIVGVGGGKALDTSKAAAFSLGIPVVCVPTIASTCAATTKLSVMYNEDGTFKDFYFFDKPAFHSFIDTQIIADAPVEYLRAGVGDTIAKHYECTFASRNDEVDHPSGVAREISKMCVTPMLSYAQTALESCNNNKADYELEQVILGIIVTTGLVSMLIEEKYNGALAHSVFYSLCLLPHIEENYLHGDVVAYGVLVQLAVDNQLKEAKSLQKFFSSLGIPTKLKDIDVPLNRKTLNPILNDILTQPDMNDIPYPITQDMIFTAMETIEAL